MARQESIVKRYIASGNEPNPELLRLASATQMGPGNGATTGENNLPPGSSVLRADTGEVDSWTGTHWQSNVRHQEMMNELRTQTAQHGRIIELMEALLGHF